MVSFKHIGSNEQTLNTLNRVVQKVVAIKKNSIEKLEYSFSDTPVTKQTVKMLRAIKIDHFDLTYEISYHNQ